MKASAGWQADRSEPALVERWVASRSVRGIETNGPIITIRGGSGWIFSSALYQDFTLHLEYRILEAGTDVGLFVRAQPGDRPTGYRIKLSDSLGDESVAGLEAGTDVYRPVPLKADRPREIVRPIGAWQSMEISCDGALLSVKVNGISIAEVDQIAPAAGVIGLGGRKGRLELRDLRALRRNPPPTTLMTADASRGIFKPGNGVTSPKLVREAKPNYTGSAMARKVQGSVWLEAIVLPDGTMGDIHVTRALDLELDQEAIATVKRWRFAPGQKDGTPVAVIIEIEMSFTLK